MIGLIISQAVPSAWSPTQVHPDAKRELFAQHLARGAMSVSRAHALVWTVTNRDTAKANAHRTKHETAMVARVAAIREELARRDLEDPGEISAANLHDLMAEVTVVFEAALAGGVLIQTSPALLSSLRRAATVHLGRVHRLQSRHPAPVSDEPGADFRLALDRVRRCDCGSADHSTGPTS